MKIMNSIKLFGKPLKVNKASAEKKSAEVGANLFIGNLSDGTDEKMLRDVFSAFGIVGSTRIMRDQESGDSKHFGFVTYDSFESSDLAIERMNGQYLDGKAIEVSYAYKKDAKHGERHGSMAERIIANNRLGKKPKNFYSGPEGN